MRQISKDPFLDWVLWLLDQVPPGPDNASVFQNYIAEWLRGSSMPLVEREVRARRGPNTWGRIDLVASCDDARVAIEIDWKRPRYKSLAKLRNFDGYRIMILRCERPYPYRLPGIDAVVCIPAIDPVQAFFDGQKAQRVLRQ